MKKTILLIIFAFINNFLLFSQTCLPEGILFTSQNEIDSFQVNYPNCTEIEGSISISGNNIINLNGLGVLTNIGGDLKIFSNDSITSFYGLNNLNSVNGDLKLTLLNGIHNMSGLDNLTFVGGKLEIGTFSVSSLTGLENLDSIGGNLDIYYTPLKNLNGLNNLISIGGTLWISLTPKLNSLTGLIGLNTIKGSVAFYKNDSLTNISALNKVTHIGGVNLEDNPLLSDLDGLNNIAIIDGNIYIEHMESLLDFSAFNNLMIMGGSMFINSNNSLTSLNGLDNINSASISSIYINGNPQLSTCAIKSVCDYIATPDADVWIEGNASGCASQLEVEANCMVDVSGHQTTNTLIYPNPANDKLVVKNDNITIREIIIYDQLSKVVFQQNNPTNNINISALPKGLYIIEIVSITSRFREKLIVE